MNTNTTRRIFLTLALLLPLSWAFAADLSATPAPTVDAALEQALGVMRSNEDVASKEYATVIISTPDGFTIAPIVKGENDNFALTVSLHKGERIVAILHTHPGTNQSTRLFSSQDVAMAKQLGVPSYIYLVKEGVAKVYMPGKDVTAFQRNGKFDATEISEGHAVASLTGKSL
jgi:proteasome lid subunit RPN8/RPN11